MKVKKIARALISVSDKTGIVEMAQALVATGCEIITSGGTRAHLMEHGISVTPVEEITGNPEAFNGRMKTLSFQISSSLLFKRDSEADLKEARELNILPLDLVICNLYPFTAVALSENDPQVLVEKIDIGGPTMIRSAAKNFNDVLVLTSSDDYPLLTTQLTQNAGGTDFQFRKLMSIKAFRHTANYDATIAAKWEEVLGENKCAESFFVSAAGGASLRYGENPHQKAAVIPHPTASNGLAQITPLQGKALSYNNLIDSDAAIRSCFDLYDQCADNDQTVVTIIKHANPCGAAISSTPLAALEKAWAGDCISAFGSIICFSKEVDSAVADWLSSKFVEVIIAPSFNDQALAAFAKKKNLRLIAIGTMDIDLSAPIVKSIWGGFVMQDEDLNDPFEFNIVTQNKLDRISNKALKFGVLVTKHLKSNAICLIAERDGEQFIIGAGMGNPNRLISLDQAIKKAKENKFTNFDQLLMISDAFFPFADNIDLANQAGLKNIVQPGGSIKDSEVIAACDKYGIAMAFTGRRHFRH